MTPTVHHVFACKSNIGDWLSALGIQRLLRDRLPGLRVVEHFCDEPFVPDTVAALSALTDRDLIVIGGGGLFMDYFLPFWERFEPLTARVPFVIWGAGYCDLKRRMSRAPVELLRRIAARSRLCVVRDPLTRGYLELPQVGEPVACPSMNYLATEPPPAHGGVLHVSHYDDVGEEAYEAMHKLCTQAAARSGGPYQQTANDIGEGGPEKLLAVLNKYRNAAVVVSSRLHGCILSVAMGRPVLAVSGDRKIESFMTMAGLAGWTCEPADVHRRLSGLLEALPSQPRPHQFLEQTRRANREVSAQVAALIRRPDQP